MISCRLFQENGLASHCKRVAPCTQLNWEASRAQKRAELSAHQKKKRRGPSRGKLVRLLDCNQYLPRAATGLWRGRTRPGWAWGSGGTHRVRRALWRTLGSMNCALSRSASMLCSSALRHSCLRHAGRRRRMGCQCPWCLGLVQPKTCGVCCYPTAQGVMMLVSCACFPWPRLPACQECGVRSTA